MRRLFALAAVLLALAGPAVAVNPNEMLADPGLENRARELGKELRCLVCQNQSIDDSDADLAKDLRIIVRERLSAGDSDNQVLKFVVDRYGDYVLLRPPFRPGTLVLWLGPLAVLVLAVFGVFAYYRRARSRADSQVAAQPLSAEEKRKLAQLMADQPKA